MVGPRLADLLALMRPNERKRWNSRGLTGKQREKLLRAPRARWEAGERPAAKPNPEPPQAFNWHDIIHAFANSEPVKFFMRRDDQRHPTEDSKPPTIPPNLDDKTPPERFLQIVNNAHGGFEVQPYPPPESAEDRALRKREELLRREESLQRRRESEQRRESLQNWTRQFGFTPLGELQPHDATSKPLGKEKPDTRTLSRFKIAFLWCLASFWGTAILLVAATTLLAFGGIAMTEGKRWLADILYFAGTSLFAAKAVYEARSHTHRKEITIIIVVAWIVIFAGLAVWTQRDWANEQSKHVTEKGPAPVVNHSDAPLGPAQAASPSPILTPSPLPSPPAAKPHNMRTKVSDRQRRQQKALRDLNLRDPP